jgi:uncharacterized membrane protein YgcG
MLHRADNERGIALVTSLMLTLISLGIIMALLFMVTQGIRQSAAQKKYHSVLEASYGSIDFFGKDLLPRLISPALDGTLSTTVTSLTSTSGTVNFSSVQLQLPTSTACFTEKLTKPMSGWTSCSSENRTSDPRSNPDISFVLAGTDNVGYRVFAKIVATQEGNTDVSGAGGGGSGGGLVAGGVVSSGGGGGGVINPGTHYPYMYTMEIQGEKATNPDERSRLTVLYAF